MRISYFVCKNNVQTLIDKKELMVVWLIVSDNIVFSRQGNSIFLPRSVLIWVLNLTLFPKSCQAQGSILQIRLMSVLNFSGYLVSNFG